MKRNILLLAFSLAFSITKSQTETPSELKNKDSIQTKELSEVIISTSQSQNETPVSIGKTNIKPMDLPQSIISIDRKVLDQQQTLRLSDVLVNTSGVYLMGNTGGYQEEIAARGFAMTGSNGVSNTFKNGVRFNNGIMPEVSALEKVEVLKGSNAILFGNVAAGSVLNIVTKKPKFENGGEVSMRTGSYAFYKPSIDVYGSVNGSDKIAYRMNATYENSKSFRDEVAAERIYFNPSLLIRATKKLNILIEADYLKDNRTTDFGTGAINYEVADVPRNTFLGAKWAYNKTEQKSVTTTLSYKLDKNWQVNGVASYQSFNNDNFGTTRPNAGGQFIKPNGTWLRGLQRSQSMQEYYLAQLDLTGKFKTASLEHNVLLGADVDYYNNQTSAFAAYKNPDMKNMNIYDSINIYDLSLYSQRQDIPTLEKTQITKNPINRIGFYIQDLITIIPKLKLMAGLRYSILKSENNVTTFNNNVTKVTKYNDNAFSPRVGLVYQPLKQLSVFTSYANSFVLNTAIDVNGNILAPSTLDQYEAGVKTDFFKGLLSANLTAYQIINKNAAQPVLVTSPNYNPVYPNAQELAGEITSKGIELDVMTKNIKGFSIIAGYSYNDTRYTKSSQYIEGSRLRYNPSHTANASLFYNFSKKLKGLNMGLTGYYVGKRVAGRSTRTTVTNDTYKLMPLPDYYLMNFTVGYRIKNVSLQVKASNLFNVLSYNVHDDNSVNPIAPRMFAATVSYKF